MLRDKNLVCHDCQKLFLFSEAEQEFFAQKGLTNLPKRCANCRLSARYRRNGENLDKLHDTQCVKCGALTVVPFAPDEDKPVYCRACFMEQRDMKAAETQRLVG